MAQEYMMMQIVFRNWEQYDKCAVKINLKKNILHGICLEHFNVTRGKKWKGIFEIKINKQPRKLHIKHIRNKVNVLIKQLNGILSDTLR